MEELRKGEFPKRKFYYRIHRYNGKLKRIQSYKFKSKAEVARVLGVAKSTLDMAMNEGNKINGYEITRVEKDITR